MALPAPALVALDVVAAAVVEVGTGYLVHRLPDRALDRDRWLFQPRPFEQQGRLYVRVLRIKRWKKVLPEAGDVFAGGFNKAALAGLSGGYLEAYVRETRRAELGHWLAMGLSPVFFLWNPWYVAAGLVACALAGNGPCVASQRYNRLRLQRVLAKRTARQRNTVER